MEKIFGFMVFGWDSNATGDETYQEVVVDDMEELLDIIEDYFEDKVLSFELCQYSGSGMYSHSVKVEFKNTKVPGKSDSLIVGHLKPQKKNKEHRINRTFLAS